MSGTRASRYKGETSLGNGSGGVNRPLFIGVFIGYFPNIF